MSKEKLYGLRDQLGKFLYDPTPDQTAWRDKMWEEGRFDEILKTTKQVEEQFDYVEKQIEAVEAAEPSIGEKLATNVLLNLPWGKGLKGMGLGSLLGIAEEELGAAETQRLKDIEQEIYELNAIRQRDLEGGKVTSGTISKIDADIGALENEGAELKQLLSTPLSEEPEDRKRRLFEEFIKDKTDLTFAEEEFLKAYPEFGSPSLRQLTPEQILEELGAQEGTVYDEELLKNAEGLAKSMGISTEDLQNALQQGEKEGIMSMISKTPTTGEKVETKTLYHRGPKGIDKLELTTDKFGWEKNALFFLNKPQKSGFGDVLYKVEANISPESSIKLGNPPKELIKNLDAEIAQSTEPNAKEELTELRGVLHGNRWFGGTSESRELMRASGHVRSLTSRQSEFLLNQGIKHLEGLNVMGVPKFLQNASSIVLDPDILKITEVDGVPRNVLQKTKGYQGGGLVMNYGDYGRSYT